MKIFKTLLFLLAVLCTTTASLYAQTGSITGVIIDANNKEAIIGAYVLLKDTPLGGVTDLDGRYIVRNIPAGNYTVSVSYVGFNTITLTDVQVTPDDQIKLDFLLESGSTLLDEVTISAFRQTSTIEAVLLEVQRMPQVVSGVSAQQIARSQDGNAAQIMQRVPGITITDNRFIIIRGLSERYNSVLINNVTAPSTEVDKRTFSFDLISSSSLDRLMIFKSGSADLPGDFAGGVIKLFTVDNAEKNFLKVSVGLGYKVGTTGHTQMRSNGSGTDFLGFDGGYRTLPSSFPDTRTLQSSPRNSPIRIDAAHSLSNNFQPFESTALADHSFGFTIGRNRFYGDRQLTSITNFGYSAGYQSYEREFVRFFEWVDRSQPILERFRFVDSNYLIDNKINIMTNWKLRLNRYSSISFKNLFNQIGENDTVIRNGFDFIQRPDDDLRSYLLGYRSRSIYTGQIEGVHDLSNAASFRWVVGGSFLRENEPDMRRFRTFRPRSVNEDNYIMIMPPSSNLFDTGRYYGDLWEFSLNHGADYSKAISFQTSQIKVGYSIDYRDRSFNSRYMSYLYPGFFDPDEQQRLIRLPLNEIFSKENVSISNGFVLEEGTRPIDSYDAFSFNTAAYISTEVPFGKFRVISGLRTEYNFQTLISADDFSEIKETRPVWSFLPFINTTYRITDIHQLRLAYGRTVNRPEFREMAPFVFYDYKMDAGRAGNPKLKHATIDNVDLRFEIYPRIGETITVGVFYKYFNDPIENKTIITTENPNFTYQNADYAVSYGLETEIRKSLIGVTGSEFLDRFSFNANASWIFTRVDLGGATTAENQIRPLQGQSPYIVNTAVYYDDIVRELKMSVIYNIIGPRIFSVGDFLYPTIYEMPRNSLDLTMSKQVTKQANLKIGVQDLLNSKHRFYQDSDRDEKVNTKKDHAIAQFKKGQHISFTLSYDF